MSTNISPSRRRELAEKHGVNEQYLYQCLTGRRDMNPAEAVRLERDTDRELTRQMLCQKTWKGIWPDLAQGLKSVARGPAANDPTKPAPRRWKARAG